MPPERWAYTLLHLAEYNGGRLPGLVEPGVSTRDPKDGDSGLYAHEHAVVQEFVLHAMYWVMSRAPIEIPSATDDGAWEPPSGERLEAERPLGQNILFGDRLADKRDLARFLFTKRAANSDSESGEEEPEPEGVLLPLSEVAPVAQTSWPGFTRSGWLLTVGMSSLCYVHCVIEIRVAGKTQ